LYAIEAENLAKRYLLGAEPELAYKTLRDTVAGLFKPRKRPAPRETLWALQDVSLAIREGEVVGIIGRNGAGKSTLLKILSRITEPTSGRARLVGRVGSLLEVGTGFHPELTGRENVFLNGTILGMRRAEIARKLDEILAFAEIERFADTPVKRYSSGMYVRLAFAVAAHLDIDIVFVDEVLAVGDAAFQRKCLAKMEDVGRAGRTVVFVSHSMAAITRLCPRAILLENGRVARDGSSVEVTHHYLASGLGTTAERVWSDPATAPGNEMVRLRAVRLKNIRGFVTDSFEIQEIVCIDIEYDNLPSHRKPYANIQVFNEQGILILSAGDFTNEGWRHRPRFFDARVRSSCTIPGNFLAEGRFTVSIALTTHNPTEAICMERDAVAFVVVDHTEGNGARGEYVGDFPGVVRPLLQWEIDCPGA
jgi:lipopolysaccharide transport system ATP-binding protein